MERRKQVFTSYQKRFEYLKTGLKTRRFVHFGTMPINNAYLMIVSMYHRHFELFEAVFNREGGSVKKTIHFLKEFSKKDGDLMAQLKELVNQPKHFEY